ncbi:MAG: histidinol-phosphate transaminase [Coriobacteriia bacterium]|jgi:histidinol-phosphate aminotransferase|nr:histidinol-phosphate transaminase [Coriobacteriia bacterium]MDR2714034.1 histidinol-phosphate transaminase [Coriobacteriales bacterium]
MNWDTFISQKLKPVEAYQPGLREEQVREIAQTERIYKLSSNESPLPPFPSAVAAMREALENLNEYPDGATHELTGALAEHYGVLREQVVIGNGSNELIDDIAMSCLEPGDNVVYCWPSFIVYRSSAQIAGVEYREIPLTAHGSSDLDALLAAIDQNTKIAYVCTPNNPTGGIVTDEDFARFIEAVPKHVLVVVDAAYEEFAGNTARLDAHKYFDGVRPLVVLRTFSKAYALAGIRCGYGLAPAPLIEAINKVREPFNVNSVAQAGALASLNDPEELKRRVELNRRGKQRLYECFEELELIYLESEANFVWVEVPDAQAVFDTLLKNGIIVRIFPAVNGLRVGVGDEEGVDATIAVFRQLFGS